MSSSYCFTVVGGVFLLLLFQCVYTFICEHRGVHACRGRKTIPRSTTSCKTFSFAYSSTVNLEDWPVSPRDDAPASASPGLGQKSCDNVHLFNMWLKHLIYQVSHSHSLILIGF